MNEGIRAPKVRVIDPEGKQLGIMVVRDAIRLAEERGLDLVEVAPSADPPVCRVVDYGKYRYQMSKKAQEARRRQTVIHIKEVKLRSKTEEHDFQFKLRHIRRFLQEGNKAKVNIVFRGREITHTELGRAMLGKVAKGIEDIGVIEQPPKLEGKNMTMVIAPK